MRLKYRYCCFQGILFDKRVTRLNGITHQGGEQPIGSDGILTVTRSMRRLSGSMAVSTADPVHLAQTFIALDGETATGLFHQPVRACRSWLPADDVRRADVSIFFRSGRAVLAKGRIRRYPAHNELVIQRIVGIHAVGTYANNRLEYLQFFVLVEIEFPLAAVLSFSFSSETRCSPSG